MDGCLILVPDSATLSGDS